MSKADARFGVVTSLELGHDIPRLAPDEFVKLSDSSLFPLFAQGYYDRSLLQYKLTAKQKQSQGPLIVCLDSSSSMQGVPDTYAKAVTAVLAQIAQQSNRHLRVIHFATNVCRVDDFPPGHHNYQKLLESLLSFFSGGGTAWKPALQEAISVP